MPILFTGIFSFCLDNRQLLCASHPPALYCAPYWIAYGWVFILLSELFSWCCLYVCRIWLLPNLEFKESQVFPCTIKERKKPMTHCLIWRLVIYTFKGNYFGYSYSNQYKLACMNNQIVDTGIVLYNSSWSAQSCLSRCLPNLSILFWLLLYLW